MEAISFPPILRKRSRTDLGVWVEIDWIDCDIIRHKKRYIFIGKIIDIKKKKKKKKQKLKEMMGEKRIILYFIFNNWFLPV